MKQETSQRRQAMDDECRVGGTVQLHSLCREKEHEMTSLANISHGEQAPRADPSPGGGGRGVGSQLSTPLWPCACSPPSHRPSSWPGRAPPLQEWSRDPPGPAGWEPGLLSPVLPRAGSAGKEREQSPGCSSLQYSQSRTKQLWSAAEQVPTKGLERAWKREGGVEIPAYF